VELPWAFQKQNQQTKTQNMNTKYEIRVAFAAFRMDNHSVPDDTLNWCREACLALADVPDPQNALTAAREALEACQHELEILREMFPNGKHREEALQQARAALALLRGEP
jgi:hypothetical protein